MVVIIQSDLKRVKSSPGGRGGLLAHLGADVDGGIEDGSDLVRLLGARHGPRTDFLEGSDRPWPLHSLDNGRGHLILEQSRAQVG